MREQEVSVLHVASAADPHALETLCHTTRALAAVGARQVLLILDESQGADLVRTAGLGAEVRRLHRTGLSFVGTIRELQLELQKLSRQGRLYAVHLHGVGACLLGSWALKGSSLPGRVLYSPHLHAASPWAIALLRHLVHTCVEPLDGVAVTASITDAHELSKLLNLSADVVPHPVGDVFFQAARNDGTRPSVLADGRGAEAMDVVTRLCVLLNGRDDRVPFSWAGPAEAGARAQLEAASVQVLGVQADAEKAQSLSRASAFIHISPGSRLPVAVAQAMAAGVPCLASDTPAHRALIRHGETGFICTSERDFLEKLVLLLRDRWESRQIGAAARAEAIRSFSLHRFERAILRAYGFSMARPLPAAAGALPPSAESHVH